MTIIQTPEEEEIQIINNVVKQIDKEIEQLHARYVKVPMGKYDDRCNKIRWKLNEKRTTRKALELLREKTLATIKEMEAMR